VWELVLLVSVDWSAILCCCKATESSKLHPSFIHSRVSLVVDQFFAMKVKKPGKASLVSR
jgi:hypothetical protein